MSKIYTYNLTPKDLKRLQDDLSKIKESIFSREIKEFILEKMNLELQDILSTSLTEDIEDKEESNYLNHFKTEIKGDSIIIYNDAEIDVAEKINEHSHFDLSKYPAKLSLAKIVEYGIGIRGENTNPKPSEDEWEYDVNKHGEKGWLYVDSNGNMQWTRGYEGRLIFYQLKTRTKNNIGKWVSEYVKNKLESK